MARPRVLITGITGMVGSHLADFLLEKTDWDIVGMCRWRSPMDNLEHLTHRINAGDRMFLQYGDLRDTMSIRDVAVKAKPISASAISASVNAPGAATARSRGTSTLSRSRLTTAGGAWSAENHKGRGRHRCGPDCSNSS